MRRGPIDRLLTWPVVQVCFGVLLLVQAISFTEAITGNLETVLLYGARLSDFLALQLFEMPDVLPLALPAALIVAIYVAVSTARQQGALVALAAAGVAPGRLIGFAMAVGAVGAGLVIVVTGELLPRARLAERILLHEMETTARIEALETAGQAPVAQDIPGVSVIFGEPGQLALGGDAEVLLINRGDGNWRYARAASAEVDGGTDGTAPTVRLVDARGFSLPGDPQPAQFAAEEVTLAFSSDGYLPEFDADTPPDEIPRLTCLNDIALPCPDDAWGDLLRAALLAPLAALLALLAVANDRALVIRGSGLVLALALSLGADVATRAASGTLGTGGAIVLCVALIAAVTASVAAQMPRLLRPDRDG